MASFFEGMFESSHYSVSSQSNITPAEAKLIKSATVIEGKFSPQVLLVMKNGATKQGALSKKSDLEVGDTIDVNSLIRIELADSATGNTCIKWDGESEN